MSTTLFDIHETANMNLSAEIGMQILTPVHVGASKEKHLYRGVDYFYLDRTVYLINKQKLFELLDERGIDLDDFSAHLVDGNESQLTRYLFDQQQIDPEEISYQVIPNSPKPNMDIFSFIRSANGQPIIPGSSLNGAIRSVLFHHIKQRRDLPDWAKGKSGKTDEAILGGFSSSITRYYRPYDAFFQAEDLELLQAQLFNLYRESYGWESDYKSDFSMSMEGLKVGSRTQFRLNIAEPLIRYIQKAEADKKQKQRRKQGRGGRRDQSAIPKNLNQVMGRYPMQYLFHQINEYTRTHLEREISFFEAYPDAEDVDTLLAELKRLYRLTEAHANQCVLRMAAGSGFHGITGDWRYEDHTEPIDHPDRQNMRWNRQTRQKEPTRYKSRKLIRLEDRMLPMGFVQLTLPERFEAQQFSVRTERRFPEDERPSADQEHKSSRPTSSKISADPVPLSSITLNETLFSARVISIKPKKVLLLIEGHQWEAQLGMGPYKHVKLKEGEIIRVVARQQNKEGKIVQVAYQAG